MSITEIIPSATLAGSCQSRRLADASPTLPLIVPGQLWLIELPSAGPPPPAARHALDAVNVVIYDRALGDVAARALPLGTYAEPAAANSGASARGVRFAQDGWSVAHLLPGGLAQRERTRRMQDFVDALAAAKVLGGLRVQIVAQDADGTAEQFAARFDDLASIVAAHPRDTLLSVAIDAFAGGGAPQLQALAVAANGLAG